MNFLKVFFLSAVQASALVSRDVSCGAFIWLTRNRFMSIEVITQAKRGSNFLCQFGFYFTTTLHHILNIVIDFKGDFIHA